jgi:hypothetical protein
LITVYLNSIIAWASLVQIKLRQATHMTTSPYTNPVEPLPALQSIVLAIAMLRGQRVILDAEFSHLRSLIATLKTGCGAIVELAYACR